MKNTQKQLGHVIERGKRSRSLSVKSGNLTRLLRLPALKISFLINSLTRSAPYVSLVLMAVRASESYN
jgi:hypothetical protein